MKKLIMTTSLVLASLVTQAQFIHSGAQVLHNLTCTYANSNSPILGVNYSMTLVTSVLAPQYSLRSATLYSTVVVPNAKPQKIELTQVTQTAAAALFENTAKNIKVKINKNNLSSKVQLSNGYVFLCK